VKRQKEMRAQRPRNARQPANEHRRVLGGRFFHVLFVFISERSNLFFVFVLSLNEFDNNFAVCHH
jgi:hypothetical protein